MASSCVYPIASGRETLLPALLILATTAAHLRGRRLAATLLFGVALFSKEQAAVLPGILILADLCGLPSDLPGARRGGWTGWIPLRTWVARYAPMAAVFAFYLAVRLSLFSGSEFNLAVVDHPLRVLLAYAYALQTSFAPTLALDYEPIESVWMSAPRLAISLCVAGGIAVAWWRMQRPQPRVLLFWLGWFVLIQLPTANILVQEAAYAERYAYLACLALPAVAAALVSVRWQDRQLRIATVAAAALCAVLAAGVTIHRARYFEDDLAFAEQWLRSDDTAPEPHHMVALALARRGDLATAIEHYQKSLELDPQGADVHNNLAAALLRAGDEKAARRHYRMAIELGPDHLSAHRNYAVLLERRGELERAAHHYREALRIGSEAADIHKKLGRTLFKLGDLAGARHHLEEARKGLPEDEGIPRALEKLEAAASGAAIEGGQPAQ
jgi:Tfp pilus assembly protein PilF